MKQFGKLYLYREEVCIPQSGQVSGYCATFKTEIAFERLLYRLVQILLQILMQVYENLHFHDLLLQYCVGTKNQEHTTTLSKVLGA